jgi:hypothetical protein
MSPSTSDGNTRVQMIMKFIYLIFPLSSLSGQQLREADSKLCETVRLFV